MSAPSPFTQRSSSNQPPQEDCRDFLRTGRCKYGASCKYNHPSNVQSGGGMKAPIDPSEPLFPIRPNEPICQYFMKHGTCKFGQACKFHHPPQAAGSANNVVNGNAVLVSVPIGRKNDGAQAMWNTGNDSGVQILPQRPDEPNCIYFLKNGRCKYGATCRYHHPLNYHDRSRGQFEDTARSRHHNTMVQQQDQRGTAKVHYLASLPPGSVQQGHFVVADGAVTFLSLDGSSPAHVVSLPQSASSGGKDGTIVYTASPGTVTASSSSTSIASSYETAVSNLEAQDSSSSLWARKVAAGGGSGYNVAHETSHQGRQQGGQGNRGVIVQNMGEGQAMGLPRVVSTGSASDGSTVYFDTHGQPQHAWRGVRSSSFDQTRSRGTNLSSHDDDDDELRRSMSVHSALDGAGRPRPPATASSMMHARSHHDMRSQRQPGEVDDGLSQMTSALLTMLDTPEEAAAHQAGYDIDDDHHSLTPRMGSRYASRPSPSSTASASRQGSSDHAYHQPSNHFTHPPSFTDSLGLSSHNQPSESQPNWMPSWQASDSAKGAHENAQAANGMPPQQPPSSPHHNSSHVGLYLP